MALVHGLSYLSQKKEKKVVYSDSKIAIYRVKIRKCKSLLRKQQPDLAVWQTVEKAEYWLQDHGVKFPLLKWKTEDWGEIPADFGRK
ncbi:MAG: hypothetical protein LBD75_04965 [Candidatus Peribacteria bacterium]|nr:hypothetical protein [Candidatus Peribacteria bacterium]